jgi:hypothetical protein
MYRFPDDDPTGIETFRSFNVLMQYKCVNTKIVHLLVNYYKLMY